MSIFSRRGGPCNSDKCHCPDCRLTKVEGRVSTLELREYNRDDLDHVRRREMQRERAERHATFLAGGYPTEFRLPFNPGANRIHTGKLGPVYRGFRNDPEVIWRWEQCKGHRKDLWRRKQLSEPQGWLGMPWSNRCNPVTPWGSSIVDGNATFTETKRVGDLSVTKSVTMSNPHAKSWVEEKFHLSPEAWKAVEGYKPRTWGDIGKLNPHPGPQAKLFAGFADGKW